MIVSSFSGFLGVVLIDTLISGIVRLDISFVCYSPLVMKVGNGGTNDI